MDRHDCVIIIIIVNNIIISLYMSRKIYSCVCALLDALYTVCIRVTLWTLIIKKRKTFIIHRVNKRRRRRSAWPRFERKKNVSLEPRPSSLRSPRWAFWSTSQRVQPSPRPPTTRVPLMYSWNTLKTHFQSPDSCLSSDFLVVFKTPVMRELGEKHVPRCLFTLRR